MVVRVVKGVLRPSKGIPKRRTSQGKLWKDGSEKEEKTALSRSIEDELRDKYRRKLGGQKGGENHLSERGGLEERWVDKR